MTTLDLSTWPIAEQKSDIDSELIVSHMMCVMSLHTKDIRHDHAEVRTLQCSTTIWNKAISSHEAVGGEVDAWYWSEGRPTRIKDDHPSYFIAKLSQWPSYSQCLFAYKFLDMYFGTPLTFNKGCKHCSCAKGYFQRNYFKRIWDHIDKKLWP